MPRRVPMRALNRGAVRAVVEACVAVCMCGSKLVTEPKDGEARQRSFAAISGARAASASDFNSIDDGNDVNDNGRIDGKEGNKSVHPREAHVSRAMRSQQN
eukprot:3255268-Pleurochrysis_carterae.AAC.1